MDLVFAELNSTKTSKGISHSSNKARFEVAKKIKDRAKVRERGIFEENSSP